jgi:hypothetical protein
MNKTVPLALAVVVSLLTAATASAHGRWRIRAAPAPVFPVMGVPVTGFGVMPTFPTAAAPALGGFGVTPTAAAPLAIAPAAQLPALGGFGGGLSTSMTMSGDPALLSLMPSLMRNLHGALFGLPPFSRAELAPALGGMTETQVRAVVREAVGAELSRAGLAPAPGAARVDPAQVSELIKVLKAIEAKMPKPEGGGGAGALAPSPEARRAREEVRRLIAGVAATPGAPGGSDVERARAEVRRLIADAAAKPVARRE